MNPFISAKKMFRLLLSGLVFCHITISVVSQENSIYSDKQHFSRVFSHKKSYRIYLPNGYETSNKKYPVIYFFHGWGGRHFKDDNALLNYTGIKDLVDKYQTILVMWDGNMDTTEPRPYNIGNHADVKFSVQMKDYFPEIIEHIDTSFRTISNRQHRGIIGFSMGGFMSFYLAGKYPDMIGAAVSLAGSPEFYVGSPENHTLYPIRYTFKNLTNTSIRMHNGDSDILYHLNEEVIQGAKWEKVALDYWKFKGGHMIDYPSETKVFESAMNFITNSFGGFPKRPDRFSHYDLYSNFTSWDYHIQSNKKDPGFLYLKNADYNGFGIYTKKWLPDGPPLAVDSIFIQTAPIYRPNKKYTILHYDKKTAKIKLSNKKADAHGGLFFLQSGDSEIGIFSATDRSSIIFLDYKANKNSRYLYNNQNGELAIRLLNRGTTNYPTGQLTIQLTCTEENVTLHPSTIKVTVQKGQRIISLPSVTIITNKKAPIHAEPPQLNLILKIQNDSQYFTDNFVVPVLYEGPQLDSIQLKDENGNGRAESGEQLQLQSGTHRLRLYTESKWVLGEEEELLDEMIPARWPDGFSLSSVIRISPDCPSGEIIEFYASYETKSFNPIERKTHWGKVKLTIQQKGTDKK